MRVCPQAAKPYGTINLAEGADVSGRRVLVIIDRQEGGAEALAVDGITLHALLSREDLDHA